MALSDNPFIGLPLATLQAMQAQWLQAFSDIAKTGKQYSFPGLSLTQADMSDIKDTLSQLRIAIGYTTGTVKQTAQATINTRRQFSGRN